jgi:nucleoside diphosphate kinase
MEQTLVLVKGDGVRRKLVGEIIRRIEARDLDITARSLSSKNWSSSSPQHRSSP